jgi:hypothetical protein
MELDNRHLTFYDFFAEITGLSQVEEIVKKNKFWGEGVEEYNVFYKFIPQPVTLERDFGSHLLNLRKIL